MISTLIIILSFLLGSIPTGYIIGKTIAGLDIRKIGSGNIGATNVFRVLNKKMGVFVLIIDILKGIGPCLIANIFISQFEFVLVCAIAAVVGHNWTPWLLFKGGKGVATSLGAVLGISIIEPSLFQAVGVLFLIWIITFLIFRIVSVSSILTAFFLPLALPFFSDSEKRPYILIFAIILGFMIVLKHVPNIRRVIKGEEKRLL